MEQEIDRRRSGADAVMHLAVVARVSALAFGRLLWVRTDEIPDLIRSEPSIRSDGWLDAPSEIRRGAEKLLLLHILRGQLRRFCNLF